MANAPGVPIERLLTQRAWIRALARTLVRDEAGADDIEQQAWVEALERPPSHESGLRAWFATVLRRRARDAWRSESRRERREEAAARPEAGRPTADLVAEAEAQRRVVDALLSMDGPYREVLLLRFYENLAPSDIARRQGIPRETVKTRLRRALEMLRSGLARRSGGPWHLAIVPLVGRPDGGGATSIPGGVLVKATTKAAIAAAALVALGLSWWLLEPTAPVPREGGGADPTSTPIPAAAPSSLVTAQVPSPPPPVSPDLGTGNGPPSPRPPGTPRDRLPVVGTVSGTPAIADRVDIEVDAKGRVTVGGRELGMQALLGLLKERADSSREEAPPKASLVNAVLRVDRDLPWQGAQWLMQGCAGPDIRIDRIQFAAVPDSGGEEGVVPTFLPKDTGAHEPQDGPDLVEDWGEKARPNPDRKVPASQPVVVAVKVTRATNGTPVAPRDLFPYLDRRFPELRLSGFHGEIDAPPSVPTGDVLAVLDAMVRAGMKTVGFRGTRIFKGDSLAESLAEIPQAEGNLEITVAGESIAPK